VAAKLMFRGATPQLQTMPHNCWDFYIIHNYTHHANTHTQTPGSSPLTSDQVVAVAATYAKHDESNRRISMEAAGFEPAIPPTKRLETYALGRTVTEIDK